MNPNTGSNRIYHEYFRTFRDYMVTMFPLACLSAYIYGWRVAVMFLISTVIALGIDLIFGLIKGNYDFTDLSSVVCAWVFTMLLPASASYGVLMFGVLVTVLAGKYAFGSWEKVPFNPSALGYAVCAVSFPNQIFNFPEPFTRISASWEVTDKLSKGPSYTLMNGGKPDVGIAELLTGDFAGPLGSSFCLVAISCLILMMAHEAIDVETPLSFLAASVALSALFPIIGDNRWESVLTELVCAGIPFASAYMVGMPGVSPKRRASRVIYGVTTGILTILFSRYGIYEYGFCFSVLLTGPLSEGLDRLFPKYIKLESLYPGVKEKTEVSCDEQ